jgi:D-amino-acid dehydrogenase
MRITIIGAGILGLSTAYYLRRQSHDITLIESHAQAALETSFANAGLIAPSSCPPWNAPGVFWQLLKYLGKQDTPILFRLNALPSLGIWGLKFLRQSSKKIFVQNLEKNIRLANETSELMSDLVNQIPIHFDYQKKGTLSILRRQAAYDHALALAKVMEPMAVPFQALNSQQLVELEPSLAEIKNDIVGGIFHPEDAFGDAHLFTQGLAAYLKQQGVQFIYDTQATLTPKNKTEVTITINQEPYATDCIVLSAGIYSENLAKNLHLNLPLRPCKGYSITFKPVNWPLFPQCPIHDEEHHGVLTPLGERIRVAGTAEFAGFNKTLSPERIQNLFHILKNMYPKEYPFIQEKDVKKWTGLRPTCVDSVPIIGKTRYDNLYLNTGHGHLGWTLGLGSGKLLADTICQKSTALDIKKYQLDRFS